MKDRPFVLIIGGPTASGKSRLAMELARLIPIEIISADSMQIYRGLDIGTAKPSARDRKTVPHHLIDLRDPDEPFDAGQYKELVRTIVPEIAGRGRIPVLVGGTGLYIRVAMGGIFPGPPRDEQLRKRLRAEEKGERGTLHRRLTEADPVSAGRIHPSDTVRVIRALEVFHLTGRPIRDQQVEHTFSDRPFVTEFLCLGPPRELLYRWIDGRVDRMMAQGLLEEVRGLLERGYGRGLNSMKALGYREMTAHLLGETGLREAIEMLKRNTRRFAKRQITWFRGESDAAWLTVGSVEEIPGLAQSLAERLSSRVELGSGN